MASSSSKILILGGTGYIGKFVVQASTKSGHPTFALVRDLVPSDPTKASLLDSFKAAGVILVKGDIHDHESLVNAMKQVDVVISTVGFAQLPDQVKIIAAIKEARNVKRFLPSEFGTDVDRAHAIEPTKSTFELKANIRRAIEKEGIPYMYVVCNAFAGYFLANLSQPGLTSPPKEKVMILGDGEPKAIFVKEEDIGTYTIRAIDDPRTLNKTLYISPPANTFSFNELVLLWEKKIGKTLNKMHVPEEGIYMQIQESPMPMKFYLAILDSFYVKGNLTNFKIEPSFGVEATQLYADVKYTTVDEYLNHFV